MSTIKLFVSCHRPSPVPEHHLLYPIQVGTVLAEERFSGYLHDDEGENISAQNRSYCELTGQYWAWKNEEADYYGFFHYRRYLYPETAAHLPYRVEGEPSLSVLNRLGFDRLETLTEKYDLILPLKENMHLPVREHYATAPFHHGKDLDLAVEILLERYPEYRAAAEEYLSGTACYFGNIFIMKRSAFQEYCGWLFSILEEFDRRADLSGYGPQEQRVDGYLAERLLGVWAAHHRELNTLELPRVHFEPDSKKRGKQRMVNILLPPGSKRRGYIKSLKRR